MFPGIAPMGLGTVSAHLTVPPKMLPSAGWTFLTRAKGTSHRPASIQRRTRTDWIRRSTPNTFADTDTSVAGRSRVMVDCQLCDLPTPDPPVRGADVDGGFCCRGCLEVARRLEDVDDPEVDEIGDALTDGDGPTVETAPPGATEAYLAVDGMHCTTCETFFLGLRGDDCRGVHAVEANYGTETARVVYDRKKSSGPSSRTRLPDTATRSGFETGPRWTTMRPLVIDGRPPGTKNGRAARRRRLSRDADHAVVRPVVVPELPRHRDERPRHRHDHRRGTVSAVGVHRSSHDCSAGVHGCPLLLRGAYVSVRARRPNMDLLVAVAALSAYAASNQSRSRPAVRTCTTTSRSRS